MSTRLNRSLNHTLRHEGGFVNDPDDPGGATNYGVSLRFLLATGEIERFDYDGDGDVDAADVRRMTRAQARDIYTDRFWIDAFNHVRSDLLVIKLFDFGVNMGPRQRTKLLQRAINQQLPEGSRLAVDGRLGPATRLAIAEIETREPNELLVIDLEDHAARFYYALAEKRRSSRKYLFGWLRRCYDRPEL